MVMCAACKHFPGNGQLCAVAKRHATHHPRKCDKFTGHRLSFAVLQARSLATFARRHLTPASYQRVLRDAHRLAEEVRR
ncbi:hypothetical protein [Alkalilimnicola ehrlichii]|uniref:hypothetical protein n=1 Tax=Alkalilimnicola ehrlichii TaxID=351052 RepID=UPI003BA25F6A